jgi:hypothetical protein
MFGRGLRGEGATEQLSGRDTSIARELPGADTETVTVVTSMAGLLGAVAYADRNYSANEARDRDRQHWLPPTPRNPPPFRDLVTVRLPRLCTKWGRHGVEAIGIVFRSRFQGDVGQSRVSQRVSPWGTNGFNSGASIVTC